MLNVLSLRRLAFGAALCAAVVASALVSSPAHAWWAPGGWGWRPGVVVAGPPIVYAPPPIAYVTPPPVIVARPRAHWVPGHFNGRGYWVPAHWA